MRINLNTKISQLLFLFICKLCCAQSYELTNATVEILSRPNSINGEYFIPDYNSFSKPLIAQPFAENANCYNVASDVFSQAGNVPNVFFGGDVPPVHGYYDVSSLIATKANYVKSDFPILMESNFYSRENTAGYNEFYFWIGDGSAPYYCAATTVLPFDFESKEGILIGNVPNRSVVFNGFDKQLTGTTVFSQNNSFFTIKKWSNQKVLLDVIDNKLAVVGFWVDGNCVFNAFESGYMYLGDTPWLDNFRLGVCIDDLGQGFTIKTNYKYFEVKAPLDICVGDCADFEILPDALICKENLNLEWTFEGASITSANTLKVTDVCFPSEGDFDYSFKANGIILNSGSVKVSSCTPLDLDNVLILDGCTNYYEIQENDLLDYNGNLTIEAWIKPNCDAGNRMIVAKEWCNGSDFAYYLSVNEGKLHWQFDDDGDCTPTYTFATVNSEIPTDKFTHVAVVHSSVDIKLFINGKLVASEHVNGDFFPIHDSNEALRIGVYKGLTGNLGNYFSGAMDEIRIWNVALSQADISYGMNVKLTGQENGLVAYYDMTENGVGSQLPLINKSQYGAIFNAAPFGATIHTPYVIKWNEYLDIDLIETKTLESCELSITEGIPQKMYKSILWNTGATTDSIAIENGGVYSVMVESELCRFLLDTINVSLNNTSFDTLTFSICDEETVIINNQTYATTGIYTQQLTATNGCDSLLTIYVSKNFTVEHVLNFSLCDAKEVVVNDIIYAQSGQYLQTLVSASGCDSLLIINIADCNEVIHFDFESCNALTPPQSMVYNEFIPAYGQLPSCGTVTASNVYRNNPSMNKHSCTEGYSGGLAMCVSSLNGCTYTPNTDHAIVFDLDITPALDEALILNQITFYQKAPATYSWIAGPSGVNNYPTKYAIRILKDNIEIFKAIDQFTTLDWSLVTISLNDLAALKVDKKSAIKVELTPYCVIGNGATVSAWDVDELSIFIGCNQEGNRSISGKVDAFNDLLKNTSIQRHNGSIMSAKSVEDSGQFNFTNNKSSITYTFKAHNNEKVLSGVNALDLVMIQRHILGIEKFTHPLQYIAADVNKDQKITVTDMVEIRKLILGLTTGFKNNTSYRFFDKKDCETNMKPNQIRDFIEVESSALNVIELIFVPVKIGDVDGVLRNNIKFD